MKFEYVKEDGLGDYEGMYSAVVILTVGLFCNFHFVLVLSYLALLRLFYYGSCSFAHCRDVGNN
jgi:hypothetical protein